MLVQPIEFGGIQQFQAKRLTFDGWSDLVLTDINLTEGRSPMIASFRRSLLATRLDIKSFTTDNLGFMPEANYVRLNGGVEAFYVIWKMLVAGGLGKIERLGNDIMPYTAPVPPTSFDIADPEGQDSRTLSVSISRRPAILLSHLYLLKMFHSCF